MRYAVGNMTFRLLRLLSASLLAFALAAPAIGVAAHEHRHDGLHAHDAHSHPETGETHSHEHDGVHDHGRIQPEALPAVRLVPAALAEAGDTISLISLGVASQPSVSRLSRLCFDPPSRAGDRVLTSHLFNKAPPAFLS